MFAGSNESPFDLLKPRKNDELRITGS